MIWERMSSPLPTAERKQAKKERPSSMRKEKLLPDLRLPEEGFREAILQEPRNR